MRRLGWVDIAGGVLGASLLAAGLVGFGAGSLMSAAPVGLTFDPIVWAAQECHVEEPDGATDWTQSQYECFQYHVANVDELLRAPGLKVANSSLRVMFAGAAILLASMIELIWRYWPKRVRLARQLARQPSR